MVDTNVGHPTVLVVDDESSNLDSVERIFRKEGWRVLTAPTGEAALEILRSEAVNVVLTDLLMPGGMSGTDLLKAARTVAPEAEVVLMTAYGSVETAVEAMKEGAYDFVTKPLKRLSIVKTIRQALDRQALVLENRALKERLIGFEGAAGVVGDAPSFKAAMELVKQAAPSSATVLLQGESGTGKEVIARAIHELSTRSRGPFVPVNSAAIPETLLESELFGYEKGAFTGATARREGRFERAHRGTIFLDEISEMAPQVQAKLLRVLQDGQFERLGGRETLRTDVRVVAATNRDLTQEVAEGRFREDLYYRLAVITVGLPPLRERPSDVPLLAHHFLRRYEGQAPRPLRGISTPAMQALEAYHWPGNVRQLENVVHRAVVLCRGDLIDLSELPAEICSAEAPPTREIVVAIGTPLEEIERRVIHATLRHTSGDKNLAARLLGLSARTIYRKLSSESADASREPPTDAHPEEAAKTPGE